MKSIIDFCLVITISLNTGHLNYSVIKTSPIFPSSSWIRNNWCISLFINCFDVQSGCNLICSTKDSHGRTRHKLFLHHLFLFSASSSEQSCWLFENEIQNFNFVSCSLSAAWPLKYRYKRMAQKKKRIVK